MEVRIQVSTGTWQWNGGQDTGEYRYLAMEWRSVAMEWRSGYRWVPGNGMEVRIQVSTWQWNGGQDTSDFQVQPELRVQLLQPGAPPGCSAPAIRKMLNFTRGLSRVWSLANWRGCIKGTVSRDFLLQVFSWITLYPKPLKITLWSFQIFSKIRGDFRRSMCTSGGK